MNGLVLVVTLTFLSNLNANTKPFIKHRVLELES